MGCSKVGSYQNNTWVLSNIKRLGEKEWTKNQELKPHAHQRLPDGSRGGTGQQWPAAGVGDLDAADLGKA